MKGSGGFLNEATAFKQFCPPTPPAQGPATGVLGFGRRAATETRSVCPGRALRSLWRRDPVVTGSLWGHGPRSPLNPFATLADLSFFFASKCVVWPQKDNKSAC